MELFKQVKIVNFMEYSKWLLVASTLLVLACLGLIFFKGFNLGVDFAGGSVAQVRFVKDTPITKIRHAFNEAHFSGVQVNAFGSKKEVVIKIPVGKVHKDLSTEITHILKPLGQFEIRKLDSVGPKVGDELKKKGVLSLVLAILAMMLYVGMRYEWRFALASVVALLHDSLITATSVIVFNIDLNLEVIAAILTLIGYSINDTIIIFDRIREGMLTKRTNDLNFVINEAISSTLTRTLLTSLTVFFVLLVLYVFGSKILVGFSLPMLIGTIVGTYSSIFIAPRVAILLGFDLEHYHENELKKAKKKQEKERLRRQYEHGRV
ncbi:Protein-export membrane protein SecF (TC 3.A.5.1.1) [Helicobacter heilmannii]|uniref:protein translocase subunit SecF n=1 Tax=Helicobacter heilmannii TaxID=35817 RepID=UPI0006A06871|nr:protein translocase subunit SecF [Helicobacter heilmannii]GMB93975.1 Preprotein translocase subunit SecF [Helicobacter heilmannii]CRF51114.1 Protein-export membrane protein SecF (TC 3.A.5.1.1) [Helicobacter heilmannii]